MQWLIFITEGNVTLAYLSFKILTSMYLMVSYILSHVVYAFSYSNKNPVNKLVIEEREDLESLGESPGQRKARGPSASEEKEV